MTDWRLPENRREAFVRQYLLHLRYNVTSGCAGSLLPALASHFDLDDRGRAWLVWLHGNTQNPVTTLLLLEASDGQPEKWRATLAFWEDNYTELAWDTDRLHQKARFGVATDSWWNGGWASEAVATWKSFTTGNAAVAYCEDHPHIGPVSARFMLGYARLMFPTIPDVETLRLGGGRSWTARNGLALAGGAPLAQAYSKTPSTLGESVDLELLGEDILAEAEGRREASSPAATRLALESACCTFNGWHKPNRRYPGVYADAAYLRIKQGERNFGDRFGVLWAARAKDLPGYLRAEDYGPITTLDKRLQNLYRETGRVPVLGHIYTDMEER